MKRQIRRGVFETNSSSVHSLTMCMESDFNKWVTGELVWSRWGDELVPITDEIKKSIEEDWAPEEIDKALKQAFIGALSKTSDIYNIYVRWIKPLELGAY